MYTYFRKTWRMIYSGYRYIWICLVYRWMSCQVSSYMEETILSICRYEHVYSFLLCSMTEQISYFTTTCTSSTPYWSLLYNLWRDRYYYWFYLFSVQKFRKISIFKLLWFDMVLIVLCGKYISRRRIDESHV